MFTYVIPIATLQSVKRKTSSGWILYLQGVPFTLNPVGMASVRHRLKLTLEIKQLIQTMELAVIEMRHLQRSHVG